MELLAIVIGLGAALFLAVGFVVQQHAAFQQPTEERLSFRLLLALVRQPLWLAGIAAMVAGQLLGAAALGEGSLALVEPIMAANLLFALPLAAVWRRQRLGRREWAGAVSLLVGLSAFVATGDPHGGHSTRLPWPNWIISGGTIVAVAAALVASGRKLPAAKQATVWGAAAGILYGLQDALTQRTLASFSHGLVSAFVSWPVFTLLVVALMALLVGQSSFETAPLAASLPAITVAEPLTGIAFGVGVYREHLALGWPSLTIEIMAIVAMIVGVVAVARSPLVSGTSGRDEAAVDVVAHRRSDR